MRKQSTWVAWSMLAIYLVGVGVGTPLMVANGDFQRDPSGQASLLLAFTAFMVMGAVIVPHRPGNAIGWIFSAIGLLTGTGFFAWQYAYITRGSPLPGALLGAWYNDWWWYPTTILATVVTVLVFPTGRLLSARWRPVAWLTAAITATGTDLAERFDRSANQWEQISRLPVATTGPGVAALGGRILVVGGGTSDATVNSVRVYDPQTDTFSDAAPMPTARQLLKVTELGGRLYAIGGVNDTGFLATVERYTPATDTWETVAAMSTPRGNPGVVSTAGRIFVVGGASSVSGSVVPLQSSEVFDPNTNTWQPVDALLPVGRGSLSAERGPGNVILAFGGFESPVIASARAEALPISQL